MHYESSELAKMADSRWSTKANSAVICYLTALTRMPLLDMIGINKALGSRPSPLPACLCISVCRPVVCWHAHGCLLAAACLLAGYQWVKFVLSAWGSNILPSLPSLASPCDPPPLLLSELGLHTDLYLCPLLKHSLRVLAGLVNHPAGGSWVLSGWMPALSFVFFGHVAKSIKIGSGVLDPAFHIHRDIMWTQSSFSVPVPSGEIISPMIKKIFQTVSELPTAISLRFASICTYILDLNYRVLDS